MRGQTTLDFAVGVSVFLVVVAFVLTFVPGMLQPFESSVQQETARADSLAEELGAELLAEDVGTPYVLDRECTFIFFEDESRSPALPDDGENTDDDPEFADPFGTGTTSTDCNFEDTPLESRLSLETDAGAVNVRIRLVAPVESVAGVQGADGDGQPDTLCLDANDNRVVEADDPLDDSDGNQACQTFNGDDDVVLSTGDTPTSSSSIITARRAVSLEGGFADGNTDAILVVEVW
jgi:hypothetical protein